MTCTPTLWNRASRFTGWTDVDLTEEGEAHIVVDDLSELIVSTDRGITIKTTHGLAAVWDCEREVRARLSSRPLVVFLDCDGTLTSIVEDHTKAFLADDMRAANAGLDERCTVAVVSGRELAMLNRLIGLKSVYLAGSHSFEILGPCGSLDALCKGTSLLPEVHATEAAPRARLSPIEGHSVERKRFWIAEQYRQVADADVETVEGVVEEVLTEHSRLKPGHGKKVFEFCPDIDWDKGRVVIWLLEQLGLDRPAVVPIYVGDDITDEDAVPALSGRGSTVVVRHGSRRTAADYAVANTAEVKRLLETITLMEPRLAAAAGAGR